MVLDVDFEIKDSNCVDRMASVSRVSFVQLLPLPIIPSLPLGNSVTLESVAGNPALTLRLRTMVKRQRNTILKSGSGRA